MTTPVLFTVTANYEEGVTGTVSFSPNQSEADSPDLDASIPLQVVTGEISGSELTVQLVDSIGLDLGDTPLLYYVEYDTEPELNSFWFAAPGTGGTVDLNTCLRVAPSGAINIVEGP